MQSTQNILSFFFFFIQSDPTLVLHFVWKLTEERTLGSALENEVFKIEVHFFARDNEKKNKNKQTKT